MNDNKDACQLLDADHIAVKHLFVEYARLATAQPAESAAERQSLATTICDEITVHAQIEEEIFYPALRKAQPAAADVVEEGEHEHQKAKELIAQIRGLGSADDTMDRLVAELARLIEHHVKEERDELFPKAKSASGMDLMALGTQLSARQEELRAETTA